MYTIINDLFGILLEHERTSQGRSPVASQTLLLATLRSSDAVGGAESDITLVSTWMYSDLDAKKVN